MLLDSVIAESDGESVWFTATWDDGSQVESPVFELPSTDDEEYELKCRWAAQLLRH